MELDLIRITVSRKTGETLKREVIGKKYISDEEYGAGCVRMLTGMNARDAAVMIRKALIADGTINDD